MRRNRFDLSHYVMGTGDLGKLYPIAALEVLPGDSFRASTSILVRVSPLVAPVMHAVQVRVHHWYCPNRLVWDGWEDFITGESSDSIPTITTSIGPGRIGDYLGVPRLVMPVNALPYRAYNLIFNEFYRDQDLVGPRPLDNELVLNVAWEKDYFTVARPQPQSGPEAEMPVVGGAVSIRDFRIALSDQREAERRSRYGNRYTDYLRYLGVTPSDARLGRPEYLGGGKSIISFSEVLATAQSAGTPVGALKGHGIATIRTRPYRRFFEEHGHVVTMLSVRPKHIISDHVPRNFLRTTRDTYWQKENEILGQQPMTRREVSAFATNPGNVFGYTDRHEEYRRIPSRIAGEMRLATYDDWHMARVIGNNPVLNNTFVSCVPPTRAFADQLSDHLIFMAGHEVVARRIVASKGRPL